MVKFDFSKAFYNFIFGNSLENKTGFIDNMNYYFKALVELVKLHNSIASEPEKLINKDIINYLIDSWNNVRENCFSRLVEKQGLKVDYSFFEPYWKFMATVDTVKRIFGEKINQSLSIDTKDVIHNMVKLVNETNQEETNAFINHINKLYNEMKKDENFVFTIIGTILDEMSNLTGNFTKILMNELIITAIEKK